MSDQEKVWIEIPAPEPDDRKFIVNHAADFQRIRDEITAKLGQGAADRLNSVRQASDGAYIAKFDSPLKALDEAAQRHGLLVPESPESPGRPESPRPTGEVEPQAVEVDDEGFILSADGQILGHVSENKLEPGCHALPGVRAVVHLPFAVTDRGSAEWVLARIADQESKVAAVDIRQRAVNANMDAQKKKAASKAAWLRGRFGLELEAFARGELAATNGKSKKPGKTLTLDNGRVSFRTTPGTVKVTDRFRAIAWARRHGFPAMVKVTEDVVMSEMTKNLELLAATAGFEGVESGQTWAAQVLEEAGGFIERSGPREVCRIVTGIEAGE